MRCLRRMPAAVKQSSPQWLMIAQWLMWLGPARPEVALYMPAAATAVLITAWKRLAPLVASCAQSCSQGLLQGIGRVEPSSVSSFGCRQPPPKWRGSASAVGGVCEGRVQLQLRFIRVVI